MCRNRSNPEGKQEAQGSPEKVRSSRTSLDLRKANEAYRALRENI